MKIALTLEYDGSAYCGFQVQQGQPTIQGQLEEALRRVTGEDVRVVGAGRTDTGVHSLGQVVSFRARTGLPPETLARALNFYLPGDIAVVAARQMPEHFDARRSAHSREYRYLIFNRSIRSPLWRQHAYLVTYELDLVAMQHACRLLVGEHDFAAFAAVMDRRPRSTVRTVLQAEIRARDEVLALEIEANAFLPHQVRNTVGALVEVGRGKLSVENFRGFLERRDGRQAGPTAPPHGLYLVRVNYPEEELDS